MPKLKKRILNDYDVNIALRLLNGGESFGKVARHFGINKPSLKKSLDMWNTGMKTSPQGRNFKFTNGKMVIIPEPKNRVAPKSIQKSEFVPHFTEEPIQKNPNLSKPIQKNEDTAI